MSEKTLIVLYILSQCTLAITPSWPVIENYLGKHRLITYFYAHVLVVLGSKGVPIF